MKNDILIISPNTDEKLEIALEYYQLFKILDYNVNLYYPWESKEKLWTKCPGIKISKDPIRRIRNKILLLLGYATIFAEIHSSNKIIYFTNNQLSKNELTLIGTIDKIITPSTKISNQIILQTFKSKSRAIVETMPLWINYTNYPITGQSSEYENYKSNPKLKFKKTSQALLIIEPNDYLDLIKYSLIGKSFIVSPKYEDYVNHNYNGFIYGSDNDILKYVRLSTLDIAQKFGNNSRELMISKLNPNNYSRKLLNFDGGLSISLPPDPLDPSLIIKEKRLVNGTIKSFPTNHNSEFRELELSDFNELMEYLASNLFSDSYIFGFQFPEYSVTEMLKAKTLTYRLGDKGRKVHFCMDNQITNEWAIIFKNLSVISVEEGLKQIK